MAKKAPAKKTQTKKTGGGKQATAASRSKKAGVGRFERGKAPATAAMAGSPHVPAVSAEVLDRLYAVVESRRNANPATSHSARLLARGTTKIAQKFGEEAVECLIEAVAGNSDALIGESADVLYHMLVMWLDAGISPGDVWAELQRREGISGIAEKAGRVRRMVAESAARTTKIP